MRNSILMIALALLTTSPTLAEIRVSRTLNYTEGNNDFEGGLRARAGFQSCSGEEMAASYDWHMGQLEAMTLAMRRGEDPFTALAMYFHHHPRPNHCPGKDLPGYSKAYAEGRVRARLFGHNETLVRVDTQARSEGPRSFVYGRLIMLGETLYERERNNISISRGASFDRSQNFGLGPLSISVRGRASATAGIQISGGASADYVGLSGKPFANASATASASVGGWCATAGVEGHIDLIDLGLPIDLDVNLADRTWAIDSDLDYDLPSGHIKLKATWCTGGDSIPIANFNFGGRRVNLFDREGDF